MRKAIVVTTFIIWIMGVACGLPAQPETMAPTLVYIPVVSVKTVATPAPPINTTPHPTPTYTPVKPQTIKTFLTTLNLPIEGLSAEILNQQIVIENQESGSVAYRYELLDTERTFLLAYYLPLEPADDRSLYLLKFDKDTEIWLTKATFPPHQLIEVIETNNFYLLYSHFNPSAGITYIFDQDLEIVHALEGYVEAVFDDTIIYGANQVHFAPTHPNEIRLYHPFKHDDRPLLPQQPYPPLWSTYMSNIEKVYTQLIEEGWCARHNHHCRSERFTRYFRDVVINSETDSLAVVVRFSGQKADSSNRDKISYELSTGEILYMNEMDVVYIYRGIQQADALAYREISLEMLKQRYGTTFALEQLLEADTLAEIFQEQHQIPAISTVVPSPVAKDILDRDKAIAYSNALFVQQTDNKYDPLSNSQFVKIEYPNGDVGSIVTLCCISPAGGNTYIYRINKNDEVTLLYNTLDYGTPDIVKWGKDIDLDENSIETDFEFVTLFDDIDDQIIRRTGYGYAGPGNLTLGIFDFIRIANDGPTFIFSGQKAFHHVSEYPDKSAGIQGKANRRIYDYHIVDLDQDGRKEIIETSKVCDYVIDDWPVAEWTEVACEDYPKKVYIFNGQTYVEQ